MGRHYTAQKIDLLSTVHRHSPLFILHNNGGHGAEGEEGEAGDAYSDEEKKTREILQCLSSFLSIFCFSAFPFLLCFISLALFFCFVFWL
jgi:hypothetical protein